MSGARSGAKPIVRVHRVYHWLKLWRSSRGSHVVLFPGVVASSQIVEMYLTGDLAGPCEGKSQSRRQENKRISGRLWHRRRSSDEDRATPDPSLGRALQILLAYKSDVNRFGHCRNSTTVWIADEGGAMRFCSELLGGFSIGTAVGG